MIRPRGVRALSEIRHLSEPRDRIPAYATLLELILRGLLPGDQSAPSLSELIQYHSELFANPEHIFFANSVRNDLVHALGESSPDQWYMADYILEEAILWAARDLPISTQLEMLGEWQSEPASAQACMVHIGLLLSSGNVVWPNEVAYTEKFAGETAERFLGYFTEHTFSFYRKVRAIYIHSVKERLPRYSYAEGFLYCQNVDEISRRPDWPRPIGDIKFECGNSLPEPVVTVTPRT